MRERITNLFLRTEDFGLGLTFKFWLWLGKALKVEITLPDETIDGILSDNKWLLAHTGQMEGQLAELNALNRSYLEEISGLKNEIATYVPVVAQVADNRPKLARRDVEAIRALKRNGYSQKAISEIYDVNPATISRIVRGQYHKTAAA